MGRDVGLVGRSTKQAKWSLVTKLNSAQVEQTLIQFEAQVIPDDHPLVRKLNELFGDHTFFLDGNGLNVVEPNNNTEAGPPAGTIVNVANWSDAQWTSLMPYEPSARRKRRKQICPA